MTLNADRQRMQSLAAYALRKPHTQTEDGRPVEQLGNHFNVILRGSDEDFLIGFDRDRSKRRVARLAVPEADQSQWIESHSAINKSDYVPRRGLAFLDVVLDEDCEEVCRTLMDQSYDRMMSQLSPQKRLVLELSQSEFTEEQILERLIESYDLTDEAALIRSRIQSTALLVPIHSDTPEETLGASFVGGTPDLAPDEAWPTTPDGTPLGFLGQFNLEVIGDALPEAFPRSGLMSIFSVWAQHDQWDDTYAGDPTAPAKILVTPLEHLSRRTSPTGVKPYPQVFVRAVKVPDLGAITRNSPFDRLDWNDPLPRLINDFESLLMCRYFGNFNSMHGHHRLGGVGRYQQEFHDSLRNTTLAVIASFGGDEKSQMEWEDGGELTLLGNMDEIRRGHTTDTWTEIQGG